MGGFFEAGAAAFTPDPGPIAVGSVGQVLTVAANGVPAFAAASSGAMTAAITTGDEAYSAGTVPQNDAHLIFTGLDAGYYALLGCLNFWVTSGNLNYTVGLVGTTSHSFAQGLSGISGSTVSLLNTFAPGTTVSATGTVNLGQINLQAIVAFTTAGNTIAFAWAPATAGQTAHLRGGSWLQLTKVG